MHSRDFQKNLQPMVLFMRQSRDLGTLYRLHIDPGQLICSKHLRAFFDIFLRKLWIAKPWVTNDQKFNVFKNTFFVYFSSILEQEHDIQLTLHEAPPV